MSALRVALWLGVLLFAGNGLANETDRSLSQLIREQWETEEGLPQNAVYCLAQDQLGFIWFGTENGLVRFDGVKFEVFTEFGQPAVPHNFVSSLLVARDGTIWAGTRTGGLCRYRNGIFENLAGGQANTEIWGFAETGDGVIWAATNDGLVSWDGERVRAHGPIPGFAKNYITALCANPNGGVFLGTREGEVYTFRNEEFEVVLGDRGELSGSSLNALVYSPTENMFWLGHDGAGLYNYQSNRLSRIDLVRDKERESINALMLDQSGALWVATENDGLFRIKDGMASRLSREDGLDYDVLSLLQDREGSVWVGTHYEGLHRLVEGRAITLTTADGLTVPTITTVAEQDSETIWVGTRGGGLLKYSHCRFTRVPLGETEVPARADVRALLRAKDGELWVGTQDGGLGRISTNGAVQFFTTKDGLADNRVTSLVEDGETIWIGTSKGGISVFDKRTGAITTMEVPEFMKTHLRSFAHDPAGGLWIGTQNGLVRYEAGEFREIPVPEVPNMSVRMVLCETNGTLWVGTRDDGMVRIKDGKVTRYFSKNGLIHNRIYHILHTGEDLYLAGNQGVERVSLASLNDVAEGREERLITRLYTKREGLLTSECGEDSSPTAMIASNGTLWFATRDGLSYFPPRPTAARSEPPTVLVRQVTVDNQRVPAEEFGQLPPGSTRVQFDYTALSLRNPRSVFFKHMLESVDRDWVNAGNAREAVYYNLKPGKYIFRVKACNDEGIWNETGAMLAFTALPRFYQTGLFRAGATLLSIGLLLSGYRWRVRRMRIRNKELKTVVAARTRELQAEVNQRTEAEHQLRLLNEGLESRVRARTAEVSRAYENLQIELHQRHEAEQALARSEARLRRIVDSGMVGILFWHKDGTISDANDTFLRMVGYTRDELHRGQISWAALTPPEFLPRDVTALGEIERTGVCKPFEKEYIRKDGSRIPILIGGASLGGDGERGVCFVLDITKLKETEEEIRQLNLKLEARVQERTRELACANDQLAAEVQERKRVGVALAAFSHLGQKLHAARTEKEAAAIVAQTAKALIPHEVCSIELYDPDGRLTPVLESAEEGANHAALRSSISVPIRNGSRVVGVIGLKNSRPGTFNHADANTLQGLGDYCGGALERIHAEEARREIERRFATFMTNAPALAWMKDARFRYVFTNEMFQRFTGLAAEQIVVKTDYDLWPDHVAFQMRTNDAETVKTQNKLERQEQLKRHDGEARTLLTLRFLFTTASGEQFVAGMAVDISDQKRAEEALHRLPQSILEAQEAERRRVARELHDGVNQAIASIKFRIQTAEQQILRSDPRWQETCSKTKEMLDSVLHQVRRLSRNLRPGELDDFGLVAAARSACQEFELRSGIQVRFAHSDFAERFPPALELSLYRIIQEALTNAEKHSGATMVEIDLTGDESYVALEISDNGCGFDMGEVTGPRPDSGLGLLHMRERASLVGGVLSMNSSPGNGVRISIHVPVTRRETVLT